MQCGCVWWGERATNAGPPRYTIANCYSAHSVGGEYLFGDAAAVQARSEGRNTFAR
jgi:hypothetical protein